VIILGILMPPREVGERINQRLELIPVNINHIFLDPNNLRLVGLRRPTPERRFLEAGVQSSVMSMMERFDLDTLKKSFLQEGVLPVDKIVVTRYNDSDNYVVVEGNRRIAAIESLCSEHSRGEIEIDRERLQELTELTVLLLRNASKEDTMLIQGIRHVPGIKEWGAYERASAVSYLLGQGYTNEQVSNLLGGIIRPGEVARYYSSYGAIQQMKEDDEYGGHFQPDYFTYFDELLKPKYTDIRRWLDWDGEQRKFRNEENLKVFYKWLTGDGNVDQRQIRTVVELRKLPAVFESPTARRALMDGATVEHAGSQILLPSDWRRELEEFEAFIRTEIPLAEIFTHEDTDRLTRIRNLIQTILDRISATPSNRRG
jgi:hypothetical protein